VQIRVVRSGKECSISVYDLLVGDVLLVDTGERFARCQGAQCARTWVVHFPIIIDLALLPR
jgi:hypothetical protein